MTYWSVIPQLSKHLFLLHWKLPFSKLPLKPPRTCKPKRFLLTFNLCWVELTLYCKYDPSYREQWENGETWIRMVRRCDPKVIWAENQSLVQPPYTGGGSGLKSNQLSVLRASWFLSSHVLLTLSLHLLTFSKQHARREQMSWCSLSGWKNLRNQRQEGDAKVEENGVNETGGGGRTDAEQNVKSRHRQNW